MQAGRCAAGSGPRPRPDKSASSSACAARPRVRPSRGPRSDRGCGPRGPRAAPRRVCACQSPCRWTTSAVRTASSRSVSGPLRVNAAPSAPGSSRDGVGVTMVTAPPIEPQGRSSSPGCSAPCLRHARGRARCKDAPSRRAPVAGSRSAEAGRMIRRTGLARPLIQSAVSNHRFNIAPMLKTTAPTLLAGAAAAVWASSSASSGTAGQIGRGPSSRRFRPRGGPWPGGRRPGQFAIQDSLVVISSMSCGSNRPPVCALGLGDERVDAAGAVGDQKRQAASGRFVGDQAPRLRETRQHKCAGVRIPARQLMDLEEARLVDRPRATTPGDRVVHVRYAEPIPADDEIPGRPGVALLPIACEGLDEPDQVLLGHKAADRQEIGGLG